VPLLSVLLPARDAARWIDAALASIRGQTVRDLEIIAVDDGSVDDTGLRLEAAAHSDVRIHVVRTERRGLPAALETARGIAQGCYLARHDADDVSHRRRFEIQLARLLASDAGVIGCRVRLFPSEGVGEGMRRWAAWHNALLTHEEMARDVYIDSPLAHGTALFRAEALALVGGWRERAWPEDLDLWVRMLERGVRLAKAPERLYAWRQHGQSATRVDPRYAPERFRALKLDALARGLLLGRRRVTVAGVGTSARGWAEALGKGGLAVDVVDAPRPRTETLARLTEPVVLVFGAQPARARWRAALAAHGMTEGRQFAFVA
jgi:glycosyltransferase involved in cell wall biosynthesis